MFFDIFCEQTIKAHILFCFVFFFLLSVPLDYYFTLIIFESR